MDDAFCPNPHVPNFFLPPSSPEDILEIISGLKGQTMDALDVHTRFLKDGALYLANPISFLVNLSLSSATFPAVFKNARLVPIHKKGPKDEAANYRPISILPLLSKIFEKYVDKLLRAHMDLHNLWNPQQFGFRKGLCTLMALSCLHEQVINNFILKNLGVGLFLDIRKAFDSVNHAALLKKLPGYGIVGLPKKWMESYLNGRSQFVSTPDGPTPCVKVIAGVPQGSVLGPLLFIIFVNDLPSNLKFLSADDTNLFLFSRELLELVTLSALDLEKVSRWFEENHLLPNVDKSFSLLFASQALLRHHPTSLPPIPFHGSEIACADSVKFLGLHMNSTLTWDCHVNALVAKISQLSGLFFLLRTALPTPALLDLYKALVLPLLSYGIELWGITSVLFSSFRRGSFGTSPTPVVLPTLLPCSNLSMY
eukprot:Pompholyxophrys_punicea_v1_NODE_405_length_2020_cov_5.457746.p1 type:complete len:424 gc:universal NODE_405_length_2020_cov_5.457746:1614-343(-)